MQSLLQIAVIGLLAVIFTSLLRKNNKELAIVLSLSVCAVIGVLLVQLAEPVVDFLKKLRNISGLDEALMQPLLKTVGIGLLTQISANVCADAGENAIAKMIEVCGGVLALYVSIPLLEAVLEMMEVLGNR